MKKKTNISVQDVRGIRRTPDLILGDKVVKNISGDIMDANATEELVNDKIAEVIGTAPEILDTLGEIVQELETKADKSDLDEKADKSDLDEKADKADLDDKADKSDLEDYVAKDEFEEHLDELNDDEKVIAAALNDLEDKKADKSDLDEKVDKAENITYAQLVSKRDQNELIPGQTYRITDYVTTTTQAGTQSANHAFDIIVTADDVNKLNENAKAIQHSGDTYFANSKLEAWKIWYCLDNDTNRFAWADSTNGKGVIYRMIDEFNNDVPYDFKNIQYVFVQGFEYNQWGQDTSFRRNTSLDTEVDGVMYYGYTGDKTPPAWSSANCFVTVTTLSTTMTLYSSAGGSVISWSGSISSPVNSSFTTFTFDEKGSEVSISGASKSVTGNSIASYVTNNKQTLNVIYFRSTSSTLSAYGNSFNVNCHDISFGNVCYNNTFGTNNHNSSFANNSLNNSFGNDCHSNSFGLCCYNFFGNNCYSNSFGGNCLYNFFGNGCYDNSLGGSCWYNSFGDNCSYNSFGAGCRSNSVGNSCLYNSFEGSSSHNSLGNNCQYITFSKQSTCYVIVENGNGYIMLTSTQTTSNSNLLRNITIAQGVNNTETMKTISHDTVDDTFKTTYQPANSQVISV